MSASLAKAVGRAFVFGDLNYWVLGDLNDLELKDPLGYGLTLGRSFSGGKYSLVGSVTGYTRIIEGVEPPLSVGISLGRSLASGQTLLGGISIGATESSPDFYLLFGWRVGIR